jgi:hypothetical protein
MLACMAAAVCGCAGPGLEITQAETEIGSTPVPDEQSWRADPRGWELAQVLRFHALGQPHELMYSGWVGADEVYRLEIDRSLGLYPKLIALVIRKGERVQFTVHRLHISWFGETAECIGRWRNEFQRRCEMPEARASVARDLSAAEWEELRAKIAATPLWAGGKEMSDSCPLLDGVWLHLEGYRGGDGSADLRDCDEAGSPFAALARHVIQLAGVEFEI